MKKAGLFALMALMVVGCTTGRYGPVYQPAQSQYDNGYSEYRIDDNRYRVQYRTDYADPNLAQDWALRRAAELTLQGNYDWFQVVSRNRAFTDDTFDRYDRARLYDPNGSVYRERPRYDSRYDNDAVAVIEVVMGYSPPPRGASIYDARQVLNVSRQRY